MGFSAGGHLASLTGTLYSQYTFGTDSISTTHSRPDFMCLVYAGIPEEIDITAQTPPTFLVHAKNDSTVAVEKSIRMVEALTDQGVKAEIKLYATGGHGFGPGREGTDTMQWPDAFVAWLRATGFISMDEHP